MEDEPFLAALIKEKGGVGAFAALVGESTQVVTNWRTRGVPANRCAAVAAIMGIDRRKLRPDDWRDYWPDLGESEAAKAA